MLPPVVVALGTHANKQGRVVGTNIASGNAAFGGVLGTAITRFQDMEIARTGLSELEAAAVGFDAPCVTTEPGGPLEGRPWKECLKLFVEMLKPVIEHAEKVGVPLLVEPEPDLLIETADQYLEFAAYIQSPCLGLNFDIGHFYCVNDDPAATVHKLAPLIGHVHLEG